ncbi:Ribonuclease H-like domain [Plasmopara halstedii]|uniref:Ribonuclease H-like domain n=1 Tax=Plasmopara halstedii TaxID=4781 RepID=A0A0P1AP16_PLAHL|nr:Ribonuclease H-like domain [Plasmopara halstedii]CEG43008.1 Ribonuclease H-like domain [Plasmopara halstedii]|eukprot:XP_024579377.1 Ribonuclease H-like domain [Plasmopara halstedii]
MDDWSRYLTVFLPTDKSGKTVNKYMQRYVVLTERQAGCGITQIVRREHEPAESAKFLVQRVLTDKGGEFVNKDMMAFYADRGIEHIKVGPKSSHRNAVERALQSLNDSRSRRCTSPNLLVRFGGAETLERSKSDDNAIIGYLIGFEMDTVGARVYISSENTVKFAAEVRVIEDVTYGDRHHVDPTDQDDGEWLRFATEEVGEQDDTTSISKTIVSATVAYEASMADEDRSADVDEEDEDEYHDSQNVGVNHQDMSDQADDGHDDDESVLSNFGSEGDPADEGSVADATEFGEESKRSDRRAGIDSRAGPGSQRSYGKRLEQGLTRR